MHHIINILQSDLLKYVTAYIKNWKPVSIKRKCLEWKRLIWVMLRPPNCLSLSLPHCLGHFCSLVLCPKEISTCLFIK